jgi:hypothetical protein
LPYRFFNRLTNQEIKACAAFSIGLTLILIFLVQGVFFIRANAPTYDEAMHLAAGYSYLATGDFRPEPQNPPLIKTWLALPLFLIYRLPFTPEPQDWRDATDYLVGQKFLYPIGAPRRSNAGGGALAEFADRRFSRCADRLVGLPALG